MGAALAYLLVGKQASQDGGDDGLLLVGLEPLVHVVHQTVEELKGIVLLSKVHLLSPQPGGKEGRGGEGKKGEGGGKVGKDRRQWEAKGGSEGGEGKGERREGGKGRRAEG